METPSKAVCVKSPVVYDLRISVSWSMWCPTSSFESVLCLGGCSLLGHDPVHQRRDDADDDAGKERASEPCDADAHVEQAV